eukprot:s462_g1.t1
MVLLAVCTRWLDGKSHDDSRHTAGSGQFLLSFQVGLGLHALCSRTLWLRAQVLTLWRRQTRLADILMFLERSSESIRQQKHLRSCTGPYSCVHRGSVGLNFFGLGFFAEDPPWSMGNCCSGGEYQAHKADADLLAFPGIADDSVTISKDSAEALNAMKAVFHRLCTSPSDELISANDVAKMHNLLGEPLDEDETVRMMSFFKASSPSEKVVAFDKFMSWWNELHDSSADSNQYYSQERYRQRFKVLQSRLQDPKIASIQTVTEGEVGSRRFRVWFECDGHRLSPWHDVPLRNSDESYNFICEIPKWTRKKYEIATGEIMNPIKQDVKNGVLRDYKWGDMLFNYGAFPQTWEDPKHISTDTGCPGDNVPEMQGEWL